jgi:hypothetical protein
MALFIGQRRPHIALRSTSSQGPHGHGLIQRGRSDASHRHRRTSHHQPPARSRGSGRSEVFAQHRACIRQDKISSGPGAGLCECFNLELPHCLFKIQRYATKGECAWLRCCFLRVLGEHKRGGFKHRPVILGLSVNLVESIVPGLRILFTCFIRLPPPTPPRVSGCR